MPRFLALSVSIAIASLACAGAPKLDVASHPWHEIRGSLFVIRSDAEVADLERLASDLETFIEVVRRVSDFAPQPPRYDLHIYVLREPTAIFGFLGVHSTGSRRGNIVLLSRFDSITLTRSVLFHEFVHFLLSGYPGYIPRWYHEGLAELLSTVYRREDVVTVGYVPQERMPVLHRRRLSPLRDLLSAHEYSIDDFYELAWLWVHYLHAGRGPQGANRRAQGVDFLHRLARGEPWESAFAASFGAPPEALEAELERHREKLARGRLRLLELEASELDPAPLPAPAPVLATAVASDVGEFLLFSGASEAALDVLEPVVEEHPDDPRALATLAWAQTRSLQGGSAQRNLARALERSASDARVQVQAGRVAMYGAEGESEADRHARERARAYFRRAIELDPELPAAWAELGLSYAVEGESGSPEAGISALERALKLRPADAELHLALGKLRLRNGEPERARDHLLRVDRWSFWEPWREEARDLLERAVPPSP